MKSMKKILCVVLSVIMMLSSLSLMAGAIRINGEKINHLPQIYISGFGSRILHYKNDPEKTSLFFPVNSDLLMKNLTDFKKYFSGPVKDADHNAVYNYIYNAFWDTFGMATLEGDGITNADKNVVCEPTVLDYEGDGVYNFNYDSRLSPMDLAKDLYKYIKKVQKHSGSKRFELVGASYGSTILMAFLNEYPKMHKYIDSVLISVPSYDGFSVVGEIFSGDFFINHDTLTEYAFVGINNEELGLLLSILNKSGFLKILLEALLIPGLKAVALEAAMDVVRDIFATIPSMWTFVQEEYFYDAMKNLYGENYADPKRENAELIRKVTYYQEEVMQRLDEIYLETKKHGVNMNIICKYGRPPMPISEKGSFMSDGAVDVKGVTLGATASKYGETLPDDYKQAKYTQYNFISPDRCIDASTGVDPLHTWYVKGLEHTEKNAGFNKLIDYILYNDPDVYTYSRYSQFLEATPTGALVPITEMPEPKKETSIFSDIINLMKRVVKMALKSEEK